jgi:hypothetical protein
MKHNKFQLLRRNRWLYSALIAEVKEESEVYE